MTPAAALMAPLPTPAEMAAWDQAAIRRYGMPGVVLMENASREVLAVLLNEHGPVRGKRALCLAGPGNNGGDAIALARHLANLGAEVTLALTKPRQAYKAEAGQHLRMALAQGIKPIRAARLKADVFPPYDIIIDGLLGTGLSGQLREDALALVRLVNELGQRALVLAVDIPSGMSGLTGRPMPEAVHAHATVTFQAPKLGLVQPEAAPCLGSLHVRDIGLPATLRDELPTAHLLMTDDLFSLRPAPAPDMHKGTAGRVLVIGGSWGLTGAPLLAALGALRAGSGLVTIACPGGLSAMIKAGTPEVMLLPLGQGYDWSADLARELAPRLADFDALVVGPGLGREPETREFLRAVLTAQRPPVILDADGLNLAAQDRESLAALTARDVITPHPGEAATLLESGIPAVQDDRGGAACALRDKTGAVVVLKGAASIVCGPDAPLAVSPVHAPTLAVGGSGDVLAGVIASLLATMHNAFDAACLGVYWHGLAGKHLSHDYPQRGALATEIAAALPTIHSPTTPATRREPQ